MKQMLFVVFSHTVGPKDLYVFMIGIIAGSVVIAILILVAIVLLLIYRR